MPRVRCRCVQSRPGWHREEQQRERILSERRIAALSGSGGSTGTITCTSSAQRCFLAVYSWCRLSMANAGLGNNESADTTTRAVANANSAAHATNKERRCSVASTVSPNIVPHSTSFWRQRSLASVVSADTAGRSADSWQLRSTANTDSANAAAHAADSWRRCHCWLSCVAASWQHCWKKRYQTAPPNGAVP